MRRTRTRIVLGIVVLAGVSGCGGGGETVTREQASQRAEEIRTEASNLFPTLATSMSAISYTGSGQARWRICGMLPSPSGAEYLAEVTVDQANAGTTEQLAAITTVLDGQGWTSEKESSGAPTWSKQGATLTTRVKRGAAMLALSSGCLDLPGDLIDELTRPGRRDDLGLAPPA